MLRGLGWSVPALASVDVPDGDGLWRNARGNFCGGCGGRAPRIDGVCTCGAPDSDEDPEDSSSSDSSSSTNAREDLLFVGYVPHLYTGSDRPKMAKVWKVLEPVFKWMASQYSSMEEVPEEIQFIFKFATNITFTISQ